MKYIQTLSEKGKLKWQDSDAPDANGRFRDLSPKDLAAWLIKTRKGDMKKISGSLSQQVAFNKNDDPEYVKKMDKTRKEVYKQLDREDLLDKMDESLNEAKMPKKYIGNDEIVYLKTKEDSRGAHYNLYYKGHDIDKGGRRFGSEKELEDFASNYILSNQLYRKLRYEDSIPLPEAVLNEEDTWNDYPAAAKKNAQMAIDWKEKYGRDEVDAGTPVGWARAHQLAKGENLSADTVKRMAAFNRHRKNSSIKPELKETPWKDRGYVAWLIWGGDEGVDWAIEKSKEIDAMKESKQMKYIKPLHEAKRGTIHKAAKKGSFPAVIVVVQDGKVIHQEPVSTPEVAPATFNVMQKKYPKALLHLEDKTGQRLFSESVVNEGYWSHYEYDKWTKENGKPKYPKWVKVTLKEIVQGGFMDPVYDAEHNYMVLWLASLETKRRSELYAYDKKGIKELGKVGYAMYQRFYNDLTSYNMFFMQGAMYALEVSKHIRDMEANGESIEPAYYLMKEYFNNMGMDTKRSRVFNAAYEKLEKWMKDNNIKTL